MSVIQEPGSTRPGRAAGLLLVGVAVIALVIGIITIINGDGDDNPPASQPPPSSQSQNPSTSGQPPQNSQPPPPQNTQPPGQSTGQPTGQPPPQNTAQPPPPAKRTRDIPVRIYNNGTIKGLAAQAGRDFSNDGWNVVEVTNYPDSIIPTTTAYYRPGSDEEAAARELAGKFNMKVAPRLPAFGGFPAGVVVMITNDYGGK